VCGSFLGSVHVELEMMEQNLILTVIEAT
jgi:hypothetical protein